MEIDRIKPSRACAQDFRLDERPQELFKRHAVVVEKSRNRNRRRRQQTKPACGLFADDTAQAEIDTSRQRDSQHRTNKLPRRQTEKDRFPVCADFFWNFDFDKNRLRFVENLTRKCVYEIIFTDKNLTKGEILWLLHYLCSAPSDTNS